MRTGLESVPDSGTQLFESCFRVRFHEVDALGHANNASYLNYLEQAAIDHASFLGLTLDRLRGLGGVFVARRHDIVFLRPTYAGDLLRVITWLDEPRGPRVERHYLVCREPQVAAAVPVTGRLILRTEVPEDEAIVVRATTEWVFANDGGQPRRIPEDVVGLFRSDLSRATRLSNGGQ